MRGGIVWARRTIAKVYLRWVNFLYPEDRYHWGPAPDDWVREPPSDYPVKEEVSGR